MIRTLIHFISWIFSVEKTPEKVLEDLNKHIGSRYGQSRRHRGYGGKKQILLP
ncbi:MAG: hypothetical protein OEV42_08390 [Deltaproteobacteria bacterium]|nr:hypothetical protein [Deltaproteobacteria bacterium]